MKVWTSLVPDFSDGPTEHDKHDSHGPRGAHGAVVIDVLRATSVLATALAAGASEVFTCVDIAAAMQLAQRLAPRPLLCGERECQRIENFDLGNSPAEYTLAVVANRSLVMTTTNGTRAIEAAKGADEIVAASFVNLAAVTAYLAKFSTLHLICAGTNRHITGEDVLLAGAILDRLASVTSITIGNDSCRIAQGYWCDCLARSPSVDLASEFRTTLGGRNLIAAGYDADLRLCAQLDAIEIVPVCTVNPTNEQRRFVAEHSVVGLQRKPNA